jgi:hypothetical protein
MTNAINTLVTSALTAAHAYGTSIDKLRTALKGQDVPAVRATLMPYVAGFYTVPVLPLTRGEGVGMCEYTNKAKTERRTEADADAVPVKGYEAAKKALQRLTKDVMGVAVDKTVSEPVQLTRAQRAAIRACMDLGITMKLFGQGVAILK